MNRKARKEHRKRQSLKDKEERSFFDVSLSEPLREYRDLLEEQRELGLGGAEFTKIPIGLIDLAATLIASMLTGKNFLLSLHCKPSQSMGSDDADNDAFHFIRRVIKRTRISCATLILGLFYVDRFKTKRREMLRKRWRRRFDDNVSQMLAHGVHDAADDGDNWTIESMFLASTIVADKYLYDATYNNAEWSNYLGSQYTLEWINKLERSFLSGLNYELSCGEETYLDFLTYLEVSLNLKQMYGRSSLSYKDVFIMSQHLMPHYTNRLGIAMRPMEAMLLLSKLVVVASLLYLASFTVASALTTAGYVLNDLLTTNMQTVEACCSIRFSLSSYHNAYQAVGCFQQQSADGRSFFLCGMV